MIYKAETFIYVRRLNEFENSNVQSYPEDFEWTSENILNWVRNSVHQPTLWLQPPGVKAFTLAPYLKEGPVLFLFTPRNPFHLENYNYNLVGSNIARFSAFVRYSQNQY